MGTFQSVIAKAKESLSSQNFKMGFFDQAGIHGLIKEVENKLVTAKKIYQQQKVKYQDKTNQIKDRIVLIPKI